MLYYIIGFFLVSKIINNIIADKALSYTSRGNKFVYHPEQIANFLKGNGNSIISAHIAPTNACNLKCSYCNQSNRTKGAFLSLDTIKKILKCLWELFILSINSVIIYL